MPKIRRLSLRVSRRREEYAMDLEEKERLALLRAGVLYDHVFSYAPFLEVSLTLAFPSIQQSNTYRSFPSSIFACFAR